MNDCWSLYLLKCANGNLYCGISNNVEKRIKQHNGELKGGAKYTRANKPCHLVYKELIGTRSQAQKQEIAVKKMPKIAKEKLCADYLTSQQK